MNAQFGPRTGVDAQGRVYREWLNRHGQFAGWRRFPAKVCMSKKQRLRERQRARAVHGGVA